MDQVGLVGVLRDLLKVREEVIEKIAANLLKNGINSFIRLGCLQEDQLVAFGFNLGERMDIKRIFGSREKGYDQTFLEVANTTNSFTPMSSSLFLSSPIMPPLPSSATRKDNFQTPSLYLNSLYPNNNSNNEIAETSPTAPTKSVTTFLDKKEEELGSTTLANETKTEEDETSSTITQTQTTLTNPSTKPETPLRSSTPAWSKASYYFCKACWVACNSEKDRRSHILGQRHNERVYWTCQVCALSCEAPKSKDDHLTGKLHAENMARLGTNQTPISRKDLNEQRLANISNPLATDEPQKLEASVTKPEPITFKKISDPALQNIGSESYLAKLSLVQLQDLKLDLTEISKQVETAISNRAKSGVTCLVCMDKQREVLLVPCNHLIMCKACAFKQLNCAVCRTQIQER